MEGRVKILETYPKSEDIIGFTLYFHVFTDFYSDTLSKTAMFGYKILKPQSLLPTHKMEEKVLGTFKRPY